MPRNCSGDAPFLWRSCSEIVPAMFPICGADVPFLWRIIQAISSISTSYANAIHLILIFIKRKKLSIRDIFNKRENKKYYQLKRLYKEINDIERFNRKAEQISALHLCFKAIQARNGTNQEHFKRKATKLWRSNLNRNHKAEQISAP